MFNIIKTSQYVSTRYGLIRETRIHYTENRRILYTLMSNVKAVGKRESFHWEPLHMKPAGEKETL